MLDTPPCYTNSTTQSHTSPGGHQIPRRPSAYPYGSWLTKPDNSNWYDGVSLLVCNVHSNLKLNGDDSARQNLDTGPAILPPREIRTKGRPRKKRYKSAIEGESSRKRLKPNDGGDDGAGRRKCSKCGERGHYSTTCVRRNKFWSDLPLYFLCVWLFYSVTSTKQALCSDMGGWLETEVNLSESYNIMSHGDAMVWGHGIPWKTFQTAMRYGTLVERAGRAVQLGSVRNY